METLRNVSVNVNSYYSLLADRKLCSRPYVKLKRLTDLQRRYLSKDGGILGNKDNQTGKSKSKLKCRRYKIFSESSVMKQTDICNVSEKDQLADSTSRERSLAADYQLLNYISDQIFDRKHLYDPLMTQSQSSQIVVEKDCVENISKDAQPVGPFVLNVDTESSDRNHFNESLIDQESKTNTRKTAIPPVLLNKCASSNTDCSLSTGMESINFSAGYSLRHSENYDRNSDKDGDYGTVDYENHLFDIIQIVKPEKDEDMISYIGSIETVVNNNKIEDELVNEDATCIEKKFDVHNAINDPSDVEYEPSDGELEPSDCDWLPSKKVKSRKITSTNKSLQTGIPSIRRHKLLETISSIKISPERDRTTKFNFGEKDGMFIETRQSGVRLPRQCKRLKIVSQNNSPQVFEPQTDTSIEKTEKPKSDIHSENSVVNIPIKCIHCESSIDSLEDLRGHVTFHIDPALLKFDPDRLTTDTTDPEFVCRDCGDKFSNPEEFHSHWQQHGPKFFCFVCNKHFTLLNELKVHVEWHFDVISHTCGQCSAKFSTSVMYDKHLSEHESGSKFKCNGCAKEYLELNQLKIHMQNHYNIIKKNQTVCPVCGRGLCEHRQMRRHFGTVHSTEKLYAYLEDPFEVTSNFPRKSLKKSHSQDISLNEQPTSDIHEKNGVKKEPIKCMHCESSFISLVDLLNHVAVHIDLALFKNDPGVKNADFELACGDCAETFSNQQAYLSHCLSHDGKKPLKCQICDMRYKLPLRNLLRHNAVKHSEPKLPCFVCGKLYPRLYKLKLHIKWHFDGILFRCNQCSAGFSSYTQCEIHKSEHTGKTKFNCNVCAKEFPDDYHLKVHVQRTHNKKNESSVCPICGRWCKRLHNHLASVHSTEKPFACKSCPKRFSLHYRLKSHVREEHRSQNYKCNQCDKRFKQKHLLKTHLLKHSGEKPFACEICAKKFRSRMYVKTHMAAHRNKSSEKSFICKLCDKSFFYAQNLNDHTRVKHDDSHKFICNVCGKVLTRRQTLRQHMETHKK